ncbi:lysosomal alpha-mannosidase-like isoform X2 [Limulus polyphemus]|uniref:Alpha-mannosidase n=1 Tax=Limulus polyphemus TaxID=6850 RepID=A0ABM1C565_LIMPO|nr:lysosomal alpha-mannosidase-like isoform X2 [Limulus polyphemus]
MLKGTEDTKHYLQRCNKMGNYAIRMWQCRHLALLFYVMLVIFDVGATAPSSQNTTCGYQSCPEEKPGYINVHVVCHTHNDVGWLQTIDQYYQLSVKRIISSVVQSLQKDPNRRFTYVETAFFWRWWQHQTLEIQEIVRTLVNSGQLEFAGGGWTMNDEAVTHYSGIIDQITLGLRWLNDTFGQCALPRVGWQIDSFGHSREHASLLSQMFFDGLFLGRIDYQDIKNRRATKTMEFLWKVSQSLEGARSYLFTGVLPNVYWPPKGFCFDVKCADPPITDLNGKMKAYQFKDTIMSQATHYTTNHLVVTMGMDFYYEAAEKWYQSLDKLMYYVNNMQATGSRVNMFYSTPACYLRSLNQTNVHWSVTAEDFFPYADRVHSYWTGYYTSRPSLKLYAREANTFLQACKQLSTLSGVQNDDIIFLKRAVAVLQHHDAITGTEQEHVAKDYIKQLYFGIEKCQEIIGESLKTLQFGNASVDGGYKYCENLNESSCYVTEYNEKVIAVIYNPLGKTVKHYVRFPVYGQMYQVLNEKGTSIQHQIDPIPLPVQNLPGRKSNTWRELLFQTELPPLGFNTYIIREIHDYVPVVDHNSGIFSQTEHDVTLGNELLQVIIDRNSGLLKAMVLENETYNIRQSFYWYEGQPGFGREKASGAYAFNPISNRALDLSGNTTFRIVKGDIVEELQQTFTPWLSQVIRIYKGVKHLEFEWVVGPIPVGDWRGKEIVSRFESDLESNGTFYTDSNGRETMQRIRNFRPTWSLNVSEPVSGNYYPVTAWIYIKDPLRNLQLTILPDRAEGATSLYDGVLELMVHRRLLYDDVYGVSEPLNERGIDGKGLVVRGKHYLLLGSIDGAVLEMKDLAQRALMKPVITFFQANFTDNDVEEPETLAFERKFSGLQDELPSNIHLLTLERLEKNKILLRLEHFHEKDVTSELSQAVNVSLVNLFQPFQIMEIREMVLSANQYLDEVSRMRWTVANESSTQHDEPVQSLEPANFTVTLLPMEIRTFLATISVNPPDMEIPSVMNKLS